MMNRIGRGFTLIELMVVIVCMTLLMGAILSMFRSGTRTSLQGMMQIETTLEARRVIKQIHNDLKMACFPLSNDGDNIDISKVLTENKSSLPLVSYTFLSFSSYGDLYDAAPVLGSDIGPKYVSRITYSMKESVSHKPFFELRRKEEFHPKHPLYAQYPQGMERVLSPKVNFIQIAPFQVPNSTKWYYWINISLADLLDKIDPAEIKKMAGTHPEERQRGVVLADFFDVVYPEYFNAVDRNLSMARNWYTMILGPN